MFSKLDSGSALAMRKNLFWILLLLISLAVSEGAAHLSFKILRAFRGIYYPFAISKLSERQCAIIRNYLNDNHTYFRYNPTLGWTIKPHAKMVRSGYQANAEGIRSDKEYPFDPEPGKIRIAAFGDSFTHGAHVSNRNTWGEKLAAKDPRLEILNFGVDAYGLDQAFLRYKEEGVRYKPSIVFIGFMSDDIRRSVNVFRPFMHSGAEFVYTKPRFVLKDGQLSLLPNPLSELTDYGSLLTHSHEALLPLGEHDFYFQNCLRRGLFDFLATVRLVKFAIHWSRSASFRGLFDMDYFYDPKSEAFQITKILFDDFCQLALKNNSQPVILLFPGESDIRGFQKNGEKIYGSLIRYFDEQNYSYVDFLDAFASRKGTFKLEKAFVRGHYSALGNQIVAEYLEAYLAKKGFLKPGKR